MIYTDANYNTITQSTMTSSLPGASFYGGIEIYSASSNTISQSYMYNPSAYGAHLEGGSKYNTIINSTATGGSYGLFLDASSTNTAAGCYVQGSTAVYVSGAGTVVNSSVLVSTQDTGSGLCMTNASVNLSLSSNTILGGAQGAGVYLDANNKGTINLSTNTILPGARYGLYFATQTAGTQIWVTSNTVLVSTSSNWNTYGIYLNGLISGATIYNNGIYYRTRGNVSPKTAYGFYVQSSSGVNFDHNRINQPGMITGGSAVSAYFNGARQVAFKFNDVNSTGTNLTTAYLLQLVASTITVKSNVFLSSLTVVASGSSATISVDAASQSGFASQYNDFFSSNSCNTGICNGISYQFAPYWTCNGLQDGGSITENPYWNNPSAGVEDFHPLSQAGRYNPATGAFDQSDGVSSLTIDSADPAEPFTGGTLGDEPDPNGKRANQGSYGGTSQASESVLKPGGGFLKSD